MHSKLNPCPPIFLTKIKNEDEEKNYFYSYYEKRKEKYLSFCKKEIQVNTEKNYVLSTQNVEKILSLIAESAFWVSLIHGL